MELADAPGTVSEAVPSVVKEDVAFDDGVGMIQDPVPPIEVVFEDPEIVSEAVPPVGAMEVAFDEAVGTAIDPGIVTEAEPAVVAGEYPVEMTGTVPLVETGGRTADAVVFAEAGGMELDLVPTGTRIGGSVVFSGRLNERDPGSRGPSVRLKAKSVEFAGGVEVTFNDGGGAVTEG